MKTDHVHAQTQTHKGVCANKYTQTVITNMKRVKEFKVISAFIPLSCCEKAAGIS